MVSVVLRMNPRFTLSKLCAMTLSLRSMAWPMNINNIIVPQPSNAWALLTALAPLPKKAQVESATSGKGHQTT